MSAFSNFSDDILFTIFLKLPVKSILRFRCVCKSWRQLLCDPHFIKMHTRCTNQHHQYHYKFLVKSSSKSLYSVDLETSNVIKAVPRNFPSKSTSHLKFVGSCNGLLCLTIARKKEPSHLWKLLKQVKLVLWNPSTGDYKKLPAVEPSVHMYQMVGFGYDSSIDDYKIVRISTSNFEYCADMYSIKANSWKIIPHLLKANYWKTIEHQPQPDYMVCKNHPECGVYLKGFIYWLEYRSIICFDLENERFRNVPWHDDMKQKFCNDLSVMGGYLVFYEFGAKGELDVWELKEDRDNKEQWIKLMTISSKICAQIRQGYAYKFLLPVCFLENGKVLFYKEEIICENFFEGKDVLLKATPASLLRGTFAVYDPKRNSRLEAFPIQGISDNCWKCVTYIESLVSPNFA